MNKPLHLTLVTSLVLLLATWLTAVPATAALGWVGNMFPLGGSSNSTTAGNGFDVYLQVYKAGVTEPPGQGANITCTLYWAEVDTFGGAWSNITSTPMSFQGQVGNNDEYKATIAPAAGLYEFTGYCTDTTDAMQIWQDAGNGRLTVNTPAATVTDARALWLDITTLGWNGTAGASYKLLYDPNGGLVPATAAATACAGVFTAPCYVPLTASGTVSGYAQNPNATGLLRLINSLTITQAKALLKGQTAVASYDGGNTQLDISGTQIQSVLDRVYATAAAPQTLGVVYSGATPSFKVWAPTAQNVVLYRFADATTAVSTTHPLTLDTASGVWSVTGAAGWDRTYFLLGVDVYVPSEDAVVHNVVTDPYALTLSADTADTADPRAQFVNLNDADLKPTGWDGLTKPTLAAFEDITVYEMHIRDFSLNDSTVAQAERGTYMAFTYDGAGPDPNPALSDGMAHLLALQEAGLTHVHLMPTFDIASVVEQNVPRTVWPSPTGFGRAAEDQQAAVAISRTVDGFNWGYDPYHYGAVEGSYSTNPADGTQRILEFRRMVSALAQNNLRVVMDVVYNHTAAAGQDDKSVLDKIVPGYYYRYDLTGTGYNSSCCADTAAEYAMMEKLMIDTLIRFATEYKVDGFRFDLMNLHTRQNMLNVQTAVQALPNGDDIYLYGEGWNFGSAVAKGLVTCPNCYAYQNNMTGAGIGLFNDRLRDAAHGGYSTDTTQIRQQGFINGLSFDWNGYLYANRFQADLHQRMDILRSALRASGADWNGQGGPFTADPQESVPYVSKHDNETLFDQNIFKMPLAATMAERVRAQNMGLSLTGLAQGVPFFHMASDILRSKSLDRNSYDSGDWFNRVNWDLSSNNFGQGLPPAWDNSGRWGIMAPLLNNTALDPTTADMQATAAHFREILRLRQSSPLFRLQTMSEINSQVSFYNGSNSQDALLVMGLADSGTVDLDPTYETLLVLFNANKTPQNFTIAGANGFTLHPIHTDGVDEDPILTSGASFNDGTDTFTVPARTTAVFVSTNLITPPAPPSTIDFVGLLYPRGGVVTGLDEGNFGPAGFDVYVQVYEAGVTPGAGQGAGLSCFLHWGEYGQPWADVPMSYNTDVGNNDEYKAALSQATLNALASGTYGFTAYCEKAAEAPQWKQDSYDIGGNPADDDQGDGLLTVIPTADPAPASGVFVHLFEWPWPDVAKECTFLAQAGYTAVQVSPPNEHLVPTADQGGQAANDYPWWVRYQPITHDITKLASRSGSLAQFQSMVTTCNALGVDIYVDAVINHMAYEEVGAPPAGTAGTPYDNGFPTPATRFYGTQYTAADFHLDCDIASYADRVQVQRCKLSGLPDLDTASPYVQGQIQEYLQGLLDMGVAGFRIDGAKHMAAADLAAIVEGLALPGGGRPFIYTEVIDTSTAERVRDWEYTPYGDVSEFEYSVTAMGSKFNCGGAIADLETVASYANMMDSRFAITFTDNHDNQRGHGPGGACIVDHRDGRTHLLANIFTLAIPYGRPMLTSSYYWTTNPASQAGDSLGPPSSNDGGTTWGPGLGAATRPVYGAGQTAADVPANCAGTYPAAVVSGDLGLWVCEHRAPALANMVQFRAITTGEALSDWETINPNHIAFGRGDKGFVVINNGGSAAVHLYQTSLPAGTYCDVTKGELATGGTACTGPSVAVDGSGQFTATVAAFDALALHSAAKITPPGLVVGDVNILEGDSGTAVALFTVTLTATTPNTVTLFYATADATATTADNDYQPISGTLILPPNTLTQTVPVLVNGDTTEEANETFTLTLSAPTNATLGDGSTAVGTILNDDGAVLSVADASVAEGTAVGGTLLFTVTLSQSSVQTITVAYDTADGTATTADYTPASGTLTFAPGQISQSVPVSVTADALNEADETLTLTLSNASNSTIAVAVATGTILNDDAVPSLSVGGVAVLEGGTAVLTVTLSMASEFTVTVEYATADGTATAGADYTAVSGQLTFAPGQTSQTTAVLTLPDGVVEGDELFTLVLANPTHAMLADSVATITLVDDDAPAPTGTQVFLPLVVK